MCSLGDEGGGGDTQCSTAGTTTPYNQCSTDSYV